MQRQFRILSLSGGGIRGVFQAAFLSRIARELPSPLWKNFDLICGTSTGAITGMAVAMEVDIDKVVDLYRSKGSKIFRRRILGGFLRGPIYAQKPLKDQLQDVFGNKQLKDAHTKILVSSASINRYDHRVFANFPTLTRADRNLLMSFFQVARFQHTSRQLHQQGRKEATSTGGCGQVAHHRWAYCSPTSI
jgi:patatin-like phospholipase/acyl hydrolase